MAVNGMRVDALGDQRVRRTCMVVLGMHRSGTSAVTRVANLLGWDLPRDVMGASEGNHFGHWEPNAVVTLNDMLLESAGSNWRDWQAISETWLSSDFKGHYVEKAAQVLVSQYADSPLFVLKDPRICRIAPLWFEAIEAVGAKPVVAMPVRNPIEVAESLASRDGIERGYALLVWLRNVLEAEKATRGMPRCIFKYGELLADWTSFARKFAYQTGIAWPRQTIQSAAEIDRFLDKSGRHQVVTDEEALGPGNPLWVRQVYAILSRWCDDEEGVEDYKVLDRILEEFNSSSTTFAQLFMQGTGSGLGVGEAERQRKTLAEQAAQYATELEHVRQESAANIADLSEKKSALVKEYERISNDLAQKDNDLAALSARLEEAEAASSEEIEQLRARTAEVSSYAEKLEDEKQALANEIHQHLRVIEQNADLANEQSKKLAQLTELLEGTEQERQALEAHLDERARYNAEAMEKMKQEHELAINEISTKIDALMADLTQKDDLIAQLESQISASLISIQKMEERLVAGNLALDTMEKEHESKLAQLSNDLVVAEAELIRSKELVAELEERVSLGASALRQREEEVAQTLADLSIERRSVEDMKAQLDRHVAVEAGLLERMTHSDQHLHAQTAALIESEKKALEFRWQADVARKELSFLEDALARTEAAVSSTTEKNTKLERENLDLHNRASAHAQELSKMAGMHARLEAKLEAFEQVLSVRPADASSTRELETELQSARAQAFAESERNASITVEMAKLSQIAIEDAARAHEEHARLTREIDRLTKLAQSKLGQSEGERSSLLWLAQLRAYEVKQPKWWALLPTSERRRRFLKRLKASGHFDYEAYNSRYPDVVAAGLDPLEHYVRHGIFEGRNW